MTREKWIRSFGPDKEMYTMSENGKVTEYITRDKPNGDPYGRVSVFHVWNGDEWLYCGASQQKADETFAEAVSKNNGTGK